MTKNEIMFLERKDLSGNEKMVFLYLSNIEKMKPISLKMLQIKLGIARPTLIRVIESLENAGLVLKIKRRLTSTKELTSNIYITATLDAGGKVDKCELSYKKIEILKGNEYIVVDKGSSKEEL